MNEREKQFRAALARFDFKAMARAWHEEDIAWHADEWEAFIKEIRTMPSPHQDLYSWESGVFKNGNSLAVYIPKHIEVEQGVRYTFIVKELRDVVEDQ